MNDLGPHVLEWLGWVGDDGPHYPVQQRSEATTFLRFLESLSTYGRGYAEVARADQPFPMLALSAAPGRAVVHQFRSNEESYLLRGDGSSSSGELFELPIIEGLATFSGDFVLVLKVAVGAVQAFARGTAVELVGEWVPL